MQVIKLVISVVSSKFVAVFLGPIGIGLVSLFTNALNIDWEDLTSDSIGNIYIGDFGDNKKERKTYVIYKVNKPNKKTHNINTYL